MAAAGNQSASPNDEGLDAAAACGNSGPAGGRADPPSLEFCLCRLAAGDETFRKELVALACARMREMAHRMLRRYPSVRRYDDTDDVVQNALVRLHRALATVVPESPEQFVGLAALQIRRELVDLARKHAGPESHATHHETDSIRIAGTVRSRVAEAASPAEHAAALDRWTRLHEAAAGLPTEERRLFDLAWYLGVQQEEAARILGWSLRTVQRRWEKVKDALRASLPGGPIGEFSN